MLDEPTNHLDLPSIEWVENYLNNYEGAIIVVSHDRQFLDNVSETIVEVSGLKLNVYSGNYSFYLEEKAQRNEIQRGAYENQQAKIRQTERFIERFRSKATKARQVQSRVKSLERMDVVEEVIDESARVNFRFNFKNLDMQSVNILSQALQQYEGTYLVISHDRHFVSRVANKIWYIEDYQIKQYPGTYDEYEWWRAEKAEKAKEEAAKPENAPKKQAPAKPVYSDNEKQGFGRNLRKAAQRAEELEKQITELEKRKATLEARLAQPDTYGDAKKLQQANAEYKQVEGLLNTAQEDWETAMLEVEELETYPLPFQ
jgi:ATPase subunit of ABC transporter with duplicated ATPase domains